MISAIILTRLLLVSATLAAPLLDTEAPVEKVGRRLPTQPGTNLVGAAYRDLGPFTAVSGILTIPTISPNPFGTADGGRVFAWVGMDTLVCETALQTGITIDNHVDGQPIYSAWWRLFGQTYNFVDPITIQAGDSMRMSVTIISPTLATAKIENLSSMKYQVVSQPIRAPSNFCNQDAAWMVEIPSVVPNFGKMQFSEAVATCLYGPMGANGSTVQLQSIVQYKPTTRIVLPSVDFSNVYITMNWT